MKKLTLIVFAFCLASLVSLQAQTKCSTIAEIKALSSGTECIYEGYAVTAYYDGYNGIIMQDATGALLLKNSKCSYGNTSIVMPGMEISNVKGKFMTGSNMIARIEVSNSDAGKIDVYEENLPLVPQVIDFDEYMKDQSKYEGTLVKFNNVNIRTIEGTTTSQIYSTKTDNVLTISFTNALGTQVPTRADVVGFLSADWSGSIFRVSDKNGITAYAYPTINTLKVGVSEQVDRDFELVGQYAVTTVINTSTNKIVYIQEETTRSTNGLRLLLPASSDVKRGDVITGICGRFEPYNDGQNKKSATLVQNSSKSVTVVESGVQPRIYSNYIYTLTDNNMQNAYLYDGTLLSLSGGVVSKEGNNFVYVVENENGQGEKSIAIRVANVEDLSAYVGKTCPIQGVLDIAATYPENKLTLILRSVADFLEPNVVFESLADMIAAGEPAGSSMTYELKNPALVTYKFTKGGGEDSYTTYFFMLQDATAGIVLNLGVDDMDNLQVGDSIVGLRGVFGNMRGMTTNILDVDTELRKEIKVLNSGNTIEPIEVTFSELNADKGKYSNRVVLVRGVKNNQKKVLNADGSYWYDYYFTQNGVRLNYTLDTDGNPFFTFYDYMDITGVVDYRIIGTDYSVWPLSQDHIIDRGTPPVNYDAIEMNARIYSSNKSIFIEAQNGANISLYTLQGHCFYSTQAVNLVTQIQNICEKCVIILVDNIAYKVMVNQ